MAIIVNKVTSKTPTLPTTLLDLTQDTVEEDNLLIGETAHNSEGEPVRGAMPGGTTDYNALINKPSINGEELSGNKTSSQLGLIGLNEKGANNGVASLGADGKVLSSQIPTADNVVLASAMTIGGQTVTEVESALHALKDAGGGSSGGHTILNESGTEMPQRSKLQFEGAIVSDDETNGATVVETVNPVEYEEDIYGVNLLNVTATTQTINGVTFTVDNSAGTITANGTATANVDFQFVKNAQIKNILKVGESYIFTTALQGGATGNITLRYNENGTTKYVAFNTGVFTATQAMINNGIITWWVNNGQAVSNVVSKPMLRKATIQDDTYRPYNQQSIQHQLTEQTNILGAKNLIPYPYKDGDAKTALGITYAVNSDQSVKINGTATGSGGFFLCGGKSLSYFGIYQPGKYILSCGDFSVASGNRVYVAIKDTTKGTYYNTWCSGTSSDNPEQEMVIDSNNINDTFDCYIWVEPGVTVNNAIVKPMLRLASDPDNTYVPYAMTNRELTEDVGTLKTNLKATYNSAEVPFKFGIDANGNYGYIKAGADSVTPFKSGLVVSGNTGSVTVNCKIGDIIFFAVFTFNGFPTGNSSISGGTIIDYSYPRDRGHTNWAGALFFVCKATSTTVTLDLRKDGDVSYTVIFNTVVSIQ